MHSACLKSIFPRALKFLHVKDGGPNFWGKPILQKVWIILAPFLYFNFKSFVDSNLSSFIRSQCILDDAGTHFSESRNFYKLKRGDLISGWNQFCRRSDLFGPPFWISSLKVLWTQNHSHSLHLNTFCMIEGYFSRSLEISTSLRGGNQFCRKFALTRPPFCI